MTALTRIIIHWTAGGHRASVLDKQHYHFIVQGDGTVVAGNLPPEENSNVNDGIYGRHVAKLNTGSIGVALAGMMGAQFHPFSAGGAPLTAVQLGAACRLLADLCARYKIPVTRRTVLTHAEVQPTLGVPQAGKWDIRWLPGDAGVGDAVAVGDRLRAMIEAAG